MKTKNIFSFILKTISSKKIFNHSIFKCLKYNFSIKPSQINQYLSKNTSSFLFTKNQFNFCQKKLQQQQQKKQPLKPEQIPSEHLQVVQTQDKIQNQNIQVTHAKGTLSILDKVQGVKSQQSGDLYVLKFRCGQCNHHQIRSFTKHAYHNGVVMVRCNGCEKIHLVADNLGWFEDKPVNVQTMHQGQVKKIHDPAAISMFLQKAFGEEATLLGKKPSQALKSQNTLK